MAVPRAIADGRWPFPPIDESARAGEPAPSSNPKLAEGVPLSEVSGLTVVTSEGLVGGAVMDELVLLLHDLLLVQLHHRVHLLDLLLQLLLVSLVCLLQCRFSIC